jgi:hypothetical protein
VCIFFFFSYFKELEEHWHNVLCASPYHCHFNPFDFGFRLVDFTVAALVEMEIVNKMWEESLEQVRTFVFACKMYSKGMDCHAKLIPFLMVFNIALEQ